MAQFNSVYVRVLSGGNGPATLGPKVSKRFCTFAEAGAVDGNEIRSYIFEEGTDFEIGIGIYSATGPTLTRSTVRLSSIDGVVGLTKMVLGGNATVRVIAAAEDLVTQDSSGNVTITGAFSAASASIAGSVSAALVSAGALKFGAPTRRSDTTYAIQASDFDGAGLIGTNNVSAMSWTLDSSLLAGNSKLKITNAGRQPLFINAVGAKFNVFDSVTGIGYTQTNLSINQTVFIYPDGAGNWIADIGPGLSNGYEKTVSLMSFSLSNAGPFFYISGTPTIGDVIGFDYSYDIAVGGGVRNTLSFRYTFTTNTVAELETAARNLETQIKFDPTLNVILGPDNAQYFVALQEAPLPNPVWLLAMNQVWPFSPDNNPRAVVYNSPGHTVNIAMINDLGGGRVGAAIDIGSWVSLGRGTRWAGREPQAGDRIAGFFVTGETTGNSLNTHDYQPIYGSFQWTIIDPTPGAACAAMYSNARTYTWQCSGPWGNGEFTVAGAKLSVVASASGGNVAAPTAAVGLFYGADGADSYLFSRAFGGTSGLIMQSGRGSSGAPAVVVANDFLGSLSFGGYNGVPGYQQSAAIAAVATETYDGTKSGSKINFYTTPAGGNALAVAGTLWGSGGLAVGTQSTDPGTGGLALHPAASVTPAANGDLVFEATSNTSFKIKYKGSDGTVRSNTLTLS